MEVIVQDANNIVIEVDQGRQGRGISTVSLITVGADYYLQFTFTDGSTEQVGPIAPIVTEVLFAEARNAEATTILKGQPVYLFQAQGNLATVKLAFNTSDATSAKTLGLAAENIAPGAQGLITCQGTLGGLNTSAYSEGDTLYLGATAGTLTNVKPQAPNHLVYIGVVERANAGAGQIYVRVQNGYELDEIHDVLINSPVNGNTLIYDASTSLWKNAGITAGSGISVTNGASSITVGNTGVLSFSGGTTGLTPAAATTGAITLAGTLSTANGGTGLSSFTANRVLYTSSTSAIGQSSNLTFDGTNLGIGKTGGTPLDVVGTFRWNSNVGGTDVWQRFTGGAGLIYDGTTTATDLAWIRNGGEQMRLTSTGLGVGTSSPQSRLQVEGAGVVANIIASSGNGNIRLADSPTSATRKEFTAILDTTNNRVELQAVQQGVGFLPLTLNPGGGNVGIGTTLPTVRLDVEQSSNSVLNILRIRNTNAGTSAQTVMLFGNDSSSGAASISMYANVHSTSPNEFSILNRIIDASSKITFGTQNTERARIDGSGNLLVGTTTNTNSSRLTVNGTISETVSSVQYLVASQFDVGTAANEIPINGYLGALAYEDTETPALNIGTGITTGTGTICKVNGGLAGGVYRVTLVIDLTGLNSGGTANDIIGVNGTTLPCFIAQLPTMTVLGGRMTCLETPAGGDTDIDLYSAVEGTGVEDQAITALTETLLINAGAQTTGTVTYFSADPTVNGYLYLAGQGTANATYTAGRFLIEVFGV